MAIWRGSPNYTPGNQTQAAYGVPRSVRKIIIHWIVGTLAAADARFMNPAEDASAHYGIENNTVYQWVRETDTAWHAGHQINAQSIGIENSAAPGRPASDATYAQLIAICTDICNRYGLNPDTDIEPHNKYYATQCPGTMDLNRIKSGVKSNQGANMPTLASIGDVSKVYDLALGRQPYDYGKNQWIDPGAANWVGLPLNTVMYGVADSPEGQAYRRLQREKDAILKQLQDADKLNKAELAKLQADLAEVNKKFAELKDKYDSNPDTALLNQGAQALSWWDKLLARLRKGS